MAGSHEQGALSARSVPRDARRLAGGQARCRCACRAMTGRRGRQYSGGRGDLRRNVQGRRRRPHRLLVGSGSKAERPVYGRLFQTPFSDKIRNEAHVATIAVGAISEADHANSIIAAGSRRSLRDRPAASRRSRLDAARGGQDRREPNRLAQAISFRQGAIRSEPGSAPPRRQAARRHDGQTARRATMRW